jgi:hypothetical protein
MLAFGLSHHFALSLVALARSGIADTTSVVVRQTLVRLDTPDAMRARVGAGQLAMFIGASNPDWRRGHLRQRHVLHRTHAASSNCDLSTDLVPLLVIRCTSRGVVHL